ncbi:unnamed protein product [Kuraishia capsulata CBS 1993]|uniref:REM-1 domain-containing protein n=1 Tax=Kuraishia capsulata CBS 1993 TaxID=1382522 RepID=W6ML66_9ASCO|nr:uncharacterized protein KUCA_T00001477001 [Kuraishia capsulata CBS 1993]CDK25507.1 unnamed protein product [Kuraishia capsulata CBS 1993]
MMPDAVQSVDLSAVDDARKNPVLRRGHSALSMQSGLQNTTGFQSMKKSESQDTPSPKLKSVPSLSNLNLLQSELAKQKRMRAGAEKLLRVSDVSLPSSHHTGMSFLGNQSLPAYNNTTHKARMRTQSELEDANRNIITLEKKIEAMKRIQDKETDQTTRTRSNTLATNVSDSFSDDARTPIDMSTTSPTWILADILQSLGDKDNSPEFLLNKSNELVVFLQQYSSLREDLVLTSIGHRLQFLLLHNLSEVVACGFRIARYILTDLSTLSVLKSLRVDSFAIISLAKDPKYTAEREQALKLFRKFLEIDGGVHELSIGSFRAIVAVAETNDDALRPIALETLCELALLNPQSLYKANGLRAIIQSITDGPFDLSAASTATIIKMFELPLTRTYVLQEYTISSIIAPFMDGHAKNERLQNVAFLLTIILKTWPGMIAFSEKSFSHLKGLISCLTYDSPSLRSIIVHVFLDILRIRTLPWVQSNKTRTDSYQNFTYTITHSSKNNSRKVVLESESSIVNQHTALLLRASIDCGLIDKLKSVILSNNDKSTRKALLLLSEIMTLASSLIPKEFFHERDYMAMLPLVRESEVLHKNLPTAVSFLVERNVRKEGKGRYSLGMPGKPVDIINQFSKEARSKVRYMVDDSEFKQMIADTQVMTTKDYTKWNWNLLSDLITGPLMSPRRLEETIKTTKFLKRLMSFFRPFKYRFSASRKTKSSQKYIRVGCEIFRMFLSCQEGVKHLSENKLLPQIAECLAQVDPYSGITAADPVFSRQKLENTACHGYFKMLGVLSSDPNGLQMLGQWWIYNMLYHITERRTGRDDLVKLFIKEMDYRYQTHLRILLRKVATTGDTSMRIFATNHLANLLLIEECQDFACSILVTQLCDPDMEVCNIAVKLLDHYCSDKEKILQLVKKRPSLDHLGRTAMPLLLRIMSTDVGFRYLSDINFIDSELESWIEYKNLSYIYEVEKLLAVEIFNVRPVLTTASADEPSTSDTRSVPQHFFGELVKTKSGMNILGSTETFTSFCNTISSYSARIYNEHEVELYDTNLTSMFDQEKLILDLKASLWAVGHIGSSDNGAIMLEISGVVEDISYICYNTLNWTLKGTCFYVLGLIAQTSEGMEILDDLGWSTTVAANGSPLPLCLPKSMSSFFNCAENGFSSQKIPADILTQSEPESSEVAEMLNGRRSQVQLSKSSSSSVVSSLLGTGIPSHDMVLINSVLESLIDMLVNVSKAMTSLTKLKHKHAASFETEPALLLLALEVLSKYKYKPSARRYVLLELFNYGKMMELLLKKDRKRSKEQSSYVPRKQTTGATTIEEQHKEPSPTRPT